MAKKKGNLKDTISNICGVMILIGGTVITLATAGIALPAVVVTVGTASAIIGGSVLSYVTGKNPNLMKKTEGQVEELNKPAEIEKKEETKPNKE